MSNTPLLDKVTIPADLKTLEESQLKQLAEELRTETIHAVAQTGGHLGAGLGVIELTVALHYVFDTPQDKIIWDVGHQAYPHKILTGRRQQMHTLRKGGGLSGFTKRKESEYDPFGAGHSSTSISAALGMAVARDKSGGEHEVIAIIGDGAMSAGMAFEALNNAGSMKTKLIVILNDNDMSIAPPTGALSGYLSRLISSKSFLSFRHAAKKGLSILPDVFERAAKRSEQIAKEIAMGNNFFEEMGFYYVGPIDGHNLDHLLPVLKNIKASKDERPVLIHVVTEKGHGFNSPEASSEKHHAVKQFDPATLIQKPSAPAAKSYTSVFADALIAEAQADEKIIGITAAMPSGTGMDKFGKAFTGRMYDVGIAEQHAVTFAAGLAAEGYKPFCAIYSTFLQRAYDQVVHDVCIQNLPVRFAIDRAGLVGADGPTHAGSFDITYLATLPNMVVMAAADELELMHMTATAAAYNDGPSAFRYPRGEGLGLELPARGTKLPIGKGRIVKPGGKHIALLTFGTRLHEALKAAEKLEARGLTTTVADARFAKPLDETLIIELATSHAILLTLEEGSIGGFGSHVADYLGKHGLLDGGLKFRSLFLPNEYQDQDNPDKMYANAGLDAAGIVKMIEELSSTEGRKVKRA